MEQLGALGRQVRNAYRGEPTGVRVRAAVRWRTLPVRAVTGAVPSGADVLEIGCGHGLVAVALALGSPDRQVHGVDVAAGPVAVAGRAAVRAGVADRVRVDTVDPDWRPPPSSVDAVVVVDVLYLLGHDHALDLLGAAWAALRPGGVLVVKETDDRPRAKALLVRLQEHLAVRTLRLTAGRTVDPVPLDALEARLRGLGADPERRRVDRGHLHPHVVLTARRPI